MQGAKKRNLIISTLSCQLNFIVTYFEKTRKYSKSHPVNVCLELKDNCIHLNNMETKRFLSGYDEQYVFERMMLLLLKCILQIGMTCLYAGQNSEIF